ncbi:unannotated protein [freshwater metagenome]|uniref:Unannotated protein n=1 Tax=freshwater metagenome TaxID=449393 RepID=A0A6J7MCD2_9ZZZZ
MGLPRNVISPLVVALGKGAPAEAGLTQPANGGLVGTAVVAGGAEVVLLVDRASVPVPVRGAMVAVSVMARWLFGATVHQTAEMTSAIATADTPLVTPAPNRRALSETATPPALMS